jgi:hypothetical protein
MLATSSDCVWQLAPAPAGCIYMGFNRTDEPVAHSLSIPVLSITQVGQRVGVTWQGAGATHAGCRCKHSILQVYPV